MHQIMTLEEWDLVQARLGLSSLQLSICQLLFECLNADQIAVVLKMRASCVREQLGQIYDTLGAWNRISATLKIIHLRDNLRANVSGDHIAAESGRRLSG